MPAIRPAEGLELDGFVLEARLHQGGMGSLWRARNASTGERLVIKIPFLGDGEDASTIVGFEVEQMIMPRLSGPHVPRFVGLGDFDRLPYIAMELIDGVPLTDKRHGPWSIDACVTTGIKIAKALQDLHRQNVIHLDLKPTNLMRRANGDIVFIDFGLSRHLQLPDLLAEESDVPMGSAPYMAPEQVLGRRTDPRSDIFAIGVILYEWLTGEFPFGNPKGHGGLRQRLWSDPTPPRALRPDCPPWLQEVILRCLSVDPDLRYPTAAQLCFALQHPDQIRLTDLAEKTERDRFSARISRFFKSRTADLPSPVEIPPVDAAPIVMIAVDLAHGVDELASALRLQAGAILETQSNTRIAFVTVLKTTLLSVESESQPDGHNAYVQRLIELKDWARPLVNREDVVSYHVLEAVDAAAALIEYAHHNNVDHIVLGARGSSTVRRYLGSVSSQVVAQALCTVTVVRLKQMAEHKLA